jgi:hypothetical protein
VEDSSWGEAKIGDAIRTSIKAATTVKGNMKVCFYNR